MESRVKPRNERTRVVTETVEHKSKAVQSEAIASDINHIVARAMRGGQLPVLMHRQPMPDLPSNLTYQDAMNKVVLAQQAFARLPSNVRTQFDNKPENLLAAVELSKDNEGIKENLQKLGILNIPELVPLPDNHADKNLAPESKSPVDSQPKS